MQSIDTSAIINYRAPQNILAAEVAFSYSAGSLSVTDNTVYPSGDSRENLNLTVADKFGKKKEYDSTSGSITVNLVTDGFNEVDGIDALVTLSSENRIYKDGSVFGIGIGKPSGNFVMEL